MSKIIYDRLYLSVMLAVLLFFAMTVAVSAHSVELLKSDPPTGTILATSPARVHAWFNEEMQTKVSTLTVFNSSGVQVDQGDGGVDLDDPDHASMIVSLQESLPQDAYTVRWHVVLLDGDGTDGSFQFFVGQAAATTAANMATATPSSPAASTASPGAIASPSLLILGGVGGLVLVLILGFVMFRGTNRPS